jgi:hypothetical protein
MVGLTFSVVNTTEKALSRFTPIERDCYFDGEFELLILSHSQGYRYSIRNCLYEAVIENILSHCSCRPSYPEIFSNGSIPFCQGSSLNCALAWLNAMGEDDLTFSKSSKHQKLKCLQRCLLQSETMLTTTSTYPNQQTFPFRQDFCFLLQKLVFICEDKTKSVIFESNYKNLIKCGDIFSAKHELQICNEKDEANVTEVHLNEKLNNFMFSYAKHNLAVVKVYIKDPYYTKILKDEEMSFIAFIGNAGGLAGLCMGFSIVSIFELVYHCTTACLDCLIKPVLRKVKQKTISMSQP